jgi:phosphoglycolate phosphatase
MMRGKRSETYLFQGKHLIRIRNACRRPFRVYPEKGLSDKQGQRARRGDDFTDSFFLRYASRLRAEDRLRYGSNCAMTRDTNRGEAGNVSDLSTALLDKDSPPGGQPRILLFDIDGTLIRAVRRPEYRGLMNDMLIDLFGTCGRIAEVDFAGRTDLSIYREALECEGITMDTIHEKLPLIEARMVEILAELAATGEVFRLCAGVRELLDALVDEGRLFPALLTGNVEKLAEAKLRTVGIYHYFKGRGAFGSDAENRDHLPAIAAARMKDHLGAEIHRENFIVVGDTPRDISCARHFGAKVLAVATGVHTVEQLQAHAPDAVREDLSDTESVVRLLTAL